MPSDGSELEFQYPNRAVLTYFLNSVRVGIPTFSKFRRLNALYSLLRQFDLAKQQQQQQY
jgi:hypothetical protein